MATRNWHIRKEDSEILFIDKLLTGPEVEAKVESDVRNFLSSLEIEAKKIPKKNVRTPDYENTELYIEATIVHPYFPRNNEISSIITDLENNLGNCYHTYIYSDSNNKPVIKVISKEKCESSYSILCLRQHVSIYRNKIIGKIQDKSRQNENSPAYIIVLDFRAAHFDGLSLFNEISEVLLSIGEQYHTLVGIIFAIPKNSIETDISAEPLYYFVTNPFSNSKVPALNKLRAISKPVSSELIQLFIPLIIYPSGMEFSITNPCINGPRSDQLRSMGLPLSPD